MKNFWKKEGLVNKTEDFFFLIKPSPVNQTAEKNRPYAPPPPFLPPTLESDKLFIGKFISWLELNDLYPQCA